MAYRAFVHVVFTSAQVFGKAFTEAYRQAAAQSVKKGARAATGAYNANAEYGGITLDESCKILDIENKNDINIDKVNEKFKYLFEVNDAEKGGSFYLQSKIYRAAERLKWEIAQKEKKTEDQGSKEGQTNAQANTNSAQTKD
ncbi:hypothetical protein TPHA_0I00840 [Tetrapisispora phaffii CBS 4417]|uniref:Mitochondrial import inner membrane translocase subunit TIM16 n=1 Tax=Tetrapisispora phaffii (strain ATCC 24235 / CBS 4417 / NBRC 1672 / NRRL Y-8282 / UCD 70-5) TaxID=1071381 RepID=G8BXG2_TETPH|nr:hypothetical protein TPHA_0I00840 [Tetrapisispora phaffii CBS 4417]CCE64590.1 hypothetical protein TPHA_0I00840 [Tetrapisispora phaffii CBS 4417]